MYVATSLDKSWLRSVQSKLYARSRNEPDYVWRKLWGLVTDQRNLKLALVRVSRNKGARTAGVDGQTVRAVLRQGHDAFIEQLRADLRSGSYRPSPARRVLIPKAGQPGKFRPLGIPTVRDRVVQAAMKNILEPIFEADFYPVSYGFRPGKSVHAALEHMRVLMRPRKAGPKAERRLPYQWAIEGDIKGCFDNIDHHGLMRRVRRRVGDAKANRLVVVFLKAGVLSEGQFLRSGAGTPQGGILSPLLANIALGAIEERYERHVWPRHTPTTLTDPAEIEKRALRARSSDRSRRPVLFPIRYADDFIILVSVPPGPRQHEQAREVAVTEKVTLATGLKEQLHLELSDTKTLVTPVTRALRFLGHHVRVRAHPTNGRLVCLTVIPKDRSHRLRETIKDLFRPSTLGTSLAERLRTLNPMLRGWCNFYRHAWGAKHVFSAIDYYVWWTIFRWLRKKHRRVSMRRLAVRYGWRHPGKRSLKWRDGDVVPLECAHTTVERFKLGWMQPPAFASASMESPVHNERCTPGLGRGA
jgi:group II intron reverse transcriptase/maturase